MLTLFHFPFCPHSRFVRLALEEFILPARLVEERVWERREEFLVLNPAGTVPVLVVEGHPPVPGAAIIVEFLEDTLGRERGAGRFMPPDPVHRAEVRRVMSWFNDKFFAEVSEPLAAERIFKRHTDPGRSPDTEVIRAARHNVPYHLAYMDWLLQSRDWLAGDRLSYADLAAAAHISVADYLGHVSWKEDAPVKAWYGRIKSRPSFRPLLEERVSGIPPAPTYADLDF
jgi:glutathione S-transferase